MASRKEQKEAARARRLAEEQARQERQRRQRRLQMFGGIVLVAVVVIAIAVVISSGGKKGTSGLQKGTKVNQTVTTVQSLLSGIPQSGATLGKPTAPVTMIYYGDLECPICQDFTLNGGFSQLVSNDVRAGRVKVEYRAFQTATRDASTFRTQQVAALAAGQQQRFWQYTELFYHEQGQEDSGYVNESYLTGLAQQVPGLNLGAWQSARKDASLANQVSSDEERGASSGVQGTPTLIFQGPKGQAQASSAVPSYSELESDVKKVA